MLCERGIVRRDLAPRARRRCGRALPRTSCRPLLNSLVNLVGQMGFNDVTQHRHQLEFGTAFTPNFDDKGLVTVVTVDAETGLVLMVAHMNASAIEATLTTGVATYWSRSRGKLWVKGETSGTRQIVREVRVDCDQDALVLTVDVEGAGVSCHNGFKSCFYRTVVPAGSAGSSLILDDALERVDPATLYPSKDKG